MEQSLGNKPLNILKNKRKTKNIILVGPDGSGKSTFAEALSEKLTMPVFHGEGKHKDKLFRWTSMREWEGVIFDRIYPIDDIVYSELRGEEAEFSRTGRALSSLRYTSKWLIVYIDHPQAGHILLERGDDEVEPEDLERIRELYKEVLKPLPVVKIFIDQFEDMDFYVNFIIAKYFAE